ncbi:MULTISPECIES: hypothetical protein [unclassified Sedimentibacter]|uniref:hypothetical protein n=1 Tax=unclassified Sedimentibacter TaxID=2649220 RepID=UPI0027DEBE74|nr:hypothetical protein [Sedimentibacter sp. MB35-C1]WMJ78700.1 hypothetical protein RBQ61_07185 [Sedimentibacter sp. MB35-C1]
MKELSKQITTILVKRNKSNKKLKSKYKINLFLEAGFLLSFSKLKHNTVNIPIICTKLIALFIGAIYNIYNTNSAKYIFMGYMTTKETTEKWAITLRWAQVICA